ncbi:MAG TPA: hypothetical protein VII19_06995, partial [Acidimicrobiales bacterium]
SGAAAISGFVNDRSAPPLGQSRIVVRNTANVAPVDVYLNGAKIASSLANTPASPTDATVLVGAGAITMVVTKAGHPISDPLYSQSGDLVAGDLLNVFVVGDSTAHPSTVDLLTNANPLGTGYRLYASDGGCSTSATPDTSGRWGVRPSTGRSWAPRRRRSASGTGWWPATVASFRSATPTSTARPVPSR